MAFDFPTLVLIGWIPFCALLFTLMPAARACTLGIVIGWLFMPVAALKLPGLPDLDKVMSTSLGILIGIFLFQPGAMRHYRPGTADLLLLLFAGSTCVTSFTNELGAWDGFSTMFSHLLYYGVPFLLGRALLQTSQARLEAARIVVVCAAFYGILSVYEWRMSPQLHSVVYGFYPHSFNLSARWGFFRPILFFPANLALGMFFAWTTLLAWWLYHRKQLQPFMGVPAEVLVALPALGLLSSMSIGPWGLAMIGAGLLWAWSRWRRRWLVLLPALCSVGWMVTRFTGVTGGEWLSSYVAMISEQRAASLQYRIDAEELLLDHTKQQPMFGWGGWGRNRVTDDRGESVTAVDGLWIIYLSMYGLSGLTLFFLWWCWPLILAARRPVPIEMDSVVMVLAAAIALQSCNLVFNAFVSPVLIYGCGGVVSFLTAPVVYRHVVSRPAEGHRTLAAGAIR